MLEGPLPKNAVATVAYTPTMWIGNQPTYPAYNLQFNILYVVVLGDFTD